MQKLKTKSGLEFSYSSLSVIHNPERAYIRVAGSSIGEVATVFADATETAELQFDNITLRGYSKLVAIVPESDVTRVVLTKE